MTLKNIYFMLIAATGSMLFGASPVLAANQIDLKSEVFVERVVRASNGASTVVLQAPSRVLPGDNLVFILTYRNAGTAPASDFVITNPLPAAVSFQRSAEGGEMVSIDGGRSWGRLAELRVTEADGRIRHAVPEDVTHLRWQMPDSVAAGQSGRLSFRGVVR